MAKHKKKRARNRARASSPVELVTGHAKADVVVRDIPNSSHNPRHVDIAYDPVTGITVTPVKGNPRTERAYVNCKESPAAYWFYHGKIDKHQYDMAVAFQQWFEMAGGAGASAIDYERVKVDTSGIQDPISERAMFASDNLKAVSRFLNDPALYDDLHKVCAQCLPLSHVWPSRRAQRIRGAEIIEALDLLSAHFGYKIAKTG